VVTDAYGRPKQDDLDVALSRRLAPVPHEDDERDDDCRQSKDDHEHEDVETGHRPTDNYAPRMSADGLGGGASARCSRCGDALGTHSTTFPLHVLDDLTHMLGKLC
jgi:hypothetical protein